MNAQNERIERLKAELAEAKAQADLLWAEFKRKDAEISPLRDRWNAAYKQAEKLQQQIEWLSELQEEKA